ncbi:MAG: carbohydrate kinase family protein [Chloroflexi bacterium HGW-Chloroflexi-10]|nr:MAG: carbohydrate kinase family protein [Chloroflexi bacterium HGW-Chloroflexi-10]
MHWILKMTEFDVLGLGMSTIDILTTVSHLPKSNEVYAAEEIHVQGGGPVATALVALSVLGANAAYSGTIAPDKWGEMILQEFSQYQINTREAHLTAFGSSPVSVILIEKDTGHRAILYKKSDLPELQPEYLTPKMIASAKILHLDGVHLQAAIHGAILARENNVPVSFDGGAGEIWDGIELLLPLVNILVVARQFATRVTGFEDPLLAGPELLKCGANEVVITDGEKGCWYWDKNLSLHQPAFKVNVIDTTGAGDTFHGAYLYGYLQGWDPQKRLKFASAVAAIKCTRIGGRSGIPDRQQTEKFINDHDFGGLHATE